MVKTLLWTWRAVRVLAAGGAVKVSCDLGVWEPNTEKGTSLYYQAKQKIWPGTIVYPEKMPSEAEVKETVETKWNGGVTTVFDSVAKAPEISTAFLSKNVSKYLSSNTQ